MSRVLWPWAYSPIILSDRPSARIVSRFLTTSGSKVPSLSLGVSISTGPYSLWTVFRIFPLRRSLPPFPLFSARWSSISASRAVFKKFSSMKWNAPFLPKSGSPFLNCSLALAITESSSSFVIVTILSLHYSKVLGYWGWIVTQFSLQPLAKCF